jgi:N-acetylglucosaminyl-diphospho-decaprenol L-rhamnosyltransferase
MSQLEVAVIIVNYRSAALTLSSLAALAGERGPGLALRAIVVENDSGDAAALAQAIGQRFSEWATLVVSPVNGGFGAGNNLGLAHLFAGGQPPRYVHFLNPDTEIRPGAVRALVDFLEAHPEVGIAGSRYQTSSGADRAIAFRFPSVLGELERGCALGPVSRLLARQMISRPMGDQPAPVDWLPGASMMARRELIETVGGFDEEYFLYYEETDLCLRARAAGWQVWYVPASKVMHISGQSTGVTVREQAPRRLPAYWFASRRRYFSKNHGPAYAALADLAFLAGSALARMKRMLTGEPSTPFLMRDLLRGSALWPPGRRPPPERCFVPAARARSGT